MRKEQKQIPLDTQPLLGKNVYPSTHLVKDKLSSKYQPGPDSSYSEVSKLTQSKLKQSYKIGAIQKSFVN